MTNRFPRRTFLRRAAVAVALPTLVPASALGRGRVRPAGDRIGLGFIGTGAMGSYLLGEFLGRADAQVVAVCDVERSKLEQARARVDAFNAERLGKQTGSGCFASGDFRELIDHPGVDAVVIAVPDHWHVLLAVAAIRAGKDVYLEKPLSLTIAQGRALVDAVERYGAVFQHGTQQRSTWEFARAARLVRSGRLGELERVEVGVPSGWVTGEHPPEPVPEGFDYDMWLGPAPWAPYTPSRCHRETRNWVNILDYSGGLVTTWGIHHVDSAHWGMDADLTGPVEIDATGEFPPSGLFNAVVHWKAEMLYESGVRVTFGDVKHVPLGVTFHGSEGRLYVKRGAIEAEPASILSTVLGPDEAPLHFGEDHYQDFLDCIRTRARTVCPAELAHRSTTACHLVNLSLELGRKLAWDPGRERFVNDPDADRLISRPMRGPWHL